MSNNLGTLQLTGYGVDSVKIGRGVSIKMKNNTGENEQIVNFNGTSKDVQELKFNDDYNSHKILMSIIGDDKVFDIGDLNNIKNKVKSYGVAVDDSQFKETGAVTLKLPNGKTMEIDFWTDKELADFKENTTDTMTKMARSCAKVAKSALKWLYETAGEPVLKQLDRFFDRLPSYRPFG